MTNVQGQVMVEVERVFKDLLVFYQSMKASKFFKLCISNNKNGDNMPPETFDISNESGEG